MSQRKIIHIDMDAFFASVEQHDDPSLCGLPLAVGFDGPRGVVSTASYEARQYGVHSAMPIATAKRRCPQLRIVTPRFDRYKEISGRVHRIFLDYTDLVEPLSIDEAFLDVTKNRRGITLATDVAREIKQRIVEETGLTASAGVSYNKFLAKVASDYRKPDGLFVIHPTKAQGFIDSLRIEQFWGVGPKTAVRMHQMGIFTGAQLRRVSRQHPSRCLARRAISTTISPGASTSVPSSLTTTASRWAASRPSWRISASRPPSSSSSTTSSWNWNSVSPRVDFSAIRSHSR